MSFLETQSINKVNGKPKLHWSLKESGQRLIESVIPSLQITLAATAAYFLAHLGLNHPIPFLAVTVTITSLGFTRDARSRRIAQTALGMVLGIAASELWLLAFGQGLWQLPTLLLAVLLVSRFVTGSAAFTLAAATQSALVYLTVAPPGGPFMRSVDGIIGGAVALAVTALIPRDPRGMAKRDANKLFDLFLESLASIELALKNADVKSADATLSKVRRTQPLVDNWRLSLDSAIAISKISPFLRKYQDELRGQYRLMKGMDLATRNLRVIVRRIDYLLRDGVARPRLVDDITPLPQRISLNQHGGCSWVNA
ncbi:MAG: FUSC family protein [Rhodoluna sp.]